MLILMPMGVTRLAIDETAARRGQDYVTLFVDIDQARVMFVTEGNGANPARAIGSTRGYRSSPGSAVIASGAKQSPPRLCTAMRIARTPFGLSCPFSRVPDAKFHPASSSRLLVDDAGMRGGGRALSDG